MPSTAVAGGLERGASLGRYLVIDRIGQGGMGVVYSAYDPELDRRVAIKLLRPDSGTAAAESRRARLQREAQAMARLSHPNVITVHDVGTAQDQVFVAMELVDGVTLKRWLVDAQRTWREVLDVFLQAGHGLAAAHDAALVHRDFKPDNVLVGKDGKVRVTDFGLARTAGEDGEPPSPTPPPGTLGAKLTETGMVMGTPAYMAPEQHRGRAADTRADQFAFCVALYEGLYGQHPFRPQVSETTTTIEADSPEAQEDVSPADALALEVVEGRVRPPPKNSDVPAWVRRVVLRGLATEPNDRYPTMHELLAGLSHDPGVTRRRGLLLGGAVAALAALAAVGLFTRGSQGGDVCGGAPARLAKVWDPAVREHVRQAFVASKSPYAETAFARVAQDLDSYASLWIDMHVQTCRATRVTGEQSEALLDLRMSCLERRQVELAALIRLFTQADGDVVRRSVDAVALLPRVADCADAEALSARVPPADAAAAMSVKILETRLAEGVALSLAGKPVPAMEKIKAVADEARKLGYAPLTALALLHLSRATKVSGDFRGAEPICLEAISFAAAGRDDDVLIDALVELTMLEARFLANQQAARMMAAAAEAHAIRAGADDQRKARVHVARADVDYYAGRHAEALAAYEAAFAIYERIYGPDSPLLANLIGDIGDTIRTLGRPAEAIPYYERMLAIIQKAYGSDHPQAATALSNLGNIAKIQGRYDQAREYYRKAIATSEKAYGPEHANVANQRFGLAYVELIQGNHEEAALQYQASYDIRVKRLGPDNMHTASSLEGLAHVRAAQGRREEALEIYRKALAIKEAGQGDEKSLAPTLINIGLTLSKLGRYEEALRAIERSREIKGRLLGEDHREYAPVLAAIAEVHVLNNRCDRALPVLHKAMAIQDKPENADDPEVIATLTLLGDCEAGAGKGAEAVTHARRALATAEKAGLQPSMQGEIKMVLARGLWASGDRKGAVDVAEQAERDFDAAGTGGAEALAKTRKWLGAHRRP